MGKVGRGSVLVVAMLTLASAADAGTIKIAGVPSYLWYQGCGPTAAGMIIGYWDGHGFPNLITDGDGTASWTTNQDAVKAMIASADHMRDYVGHGTGMDRAATSDDPFHADDSLADFMDASAGPVLADGESYANRQPDGLAGYAAYRGYPGATAAYVALDEASLWSAGTYWTALMDEIDAGRPVELHVDTDGNNVGDHYVTVFGYDDAGLYGCWDTHDHLEHWYDFAAPGQAYGVAGMVTFAAPEPATLTLMGSGLVLALVVGRRRPRGQRRAPRRGCGATIAYHEYKGRRGQA